MSLSVCHDHNIKVNSEELHQLVFLFIYFLFVGLSDQLTHFHMKGAMGNETFHLLASYSNGFNFVSTLSH